MVNGCKSADLKHEHVFLRTQGGGTAAEIPSDSGAAAAVPLTHTTLIQDVGGEQHAIAPDWLSRHHDQEVV